MKRRNTNPFDVGNDTPRESLRERYEGSNNNKESAPTSSSLFPNFLSSWMATEISSLPSSNNSLLEDGADDNTDDESLYRYHDCISQEEDEVDTSSDYENDETTTLLSALSPLRRQSIRSYSATSNTPVRKNTGIRIDTVTSQSPQQILYSPLSQALATWLSPYADSAKRAGRKIMFSEEEDSLSSVGNSQHSNIVGEETLHSVRFHSDHLDSNGKQQKSWLTPSSALGRTLSSPALMTTVSDETMHNIGVVVESNSDSGIVLKDIVVQGENNTHSDDNNGDGIIIHPWTKLILLEELGTAWSWFVLLLPYVFLILAVFLDGDTQFKHTIVGPLRGNKSCDDMVRGSVPTPFDESVKGYYPVPFHFEDGHKHKSSNKTMEKAKFNGSCTYPFELREGVGLLSHGKDAASNSTMSSTSILNSRYRYLMSHGHAFTSGVISNVPPTSQSLRGSVKFNNLSSRAVALVARGSVLVSAIVFQRPISGNSTSITASLHWSPVLILSSKRLDMVCKLNSEDEEKHNTPTWTCSSRRIIDAFFSLPNTAVLMGGDLRVDILLSHHKASQKSFTDGLWFDEQGGIMSEADDDYVISGANDNFSISSAEKILSSADVSHPQQLLAELSSTSIYKLQHQSMAYNNVIEGTRIFSLIVTLVFLCYWWWSMGVASEGFDMIDSEEDTTATSLCARITSPIYEVVRMVSRRCKRNNQAYRFWWQDPWCMFPERRYLLMLLFCLIMLQNPLLAYAFFHPSLYGSAKFRFAADTVSGISVHGILFLWLCLVHGLRYHTSGKRRLAFHSRILELRKATSHMSPDNTEFEDTQWGRVRWYYQQYGDVEGGGTAVLKMKHDTESDSFVEFMFPKVALLFIGIVASITAAASRFPMSESSSISERIELNPDRFGSGSKVYVLSSIVQLIVIQIWSIFIVYTSFVTGERLKREPFLSTRPAQLAFRVLSGILIIGLTFSIALFYFHSLSLISNEESSSERSADDSDIVYDTSIGGSDDESWDSRADLLLTLIRRATTELPYVGTSSNIGPGKILYATACSLVLAGIFLPSSHFHPSKKEQKAADEIVALGPDQYSKQTMLSDMDKRYQGKDKRFVVALARNTHTWRVFPLPTRSHALISQHTLKEQLNIVGTLQLYFDGRHFNMHKFKFGRGAIYKGKYIPVFCVEIACWLLEASWQAYYSSTEYSLSNWAPGRMRLDQIGLKLERNINDSETDTHVFVATNISEQVEGEEDSIIVVCFRGSASRVNIKTDLSFKQVPLPEKIMSDVPCFNVRPGMPIAVDETLWDEQASSSLPSVLQDIITGPSGHYKSWPTTGEETDYSSTNACHPVDLDQSVFIPTVSNAGKAIIRATPMARQALPCVHEGFLQNYTKIRHELVETILKILKRQLEKSVKRSRHSSNRYSDDDDGVQPLTLPKIYITGHSMGGALGQLLALDLASNCEIVIEQALPNDKGINRGRGNHSRQSLSSFDNDDDTIEEAAGLSDLDWLGQRLDDPYSSSTKIPTKKIRLRPPIAVYSYGQPRLGNNAFKTIYKKRVPHTFRVCTEGDAITTMPSTGPFFGGIYRHAGLEVLLEEGCTGNILVGPTVVETLLRFTKVRTSLDAHSLERYRESLESALGREDLKEYYRGHGGKVRHNNQDGNGYLSGNSGPLPSWVTSVKRSCDDNI